MKFYPYSVKRVLEDYFGDDPVFNMRKPHRYAQSRQKKEDIIPLSWRYADELAMGLFDGQCFLERTDLCEDHIAYVYRKGAQRGVYLLYYVEEHDAPFRMNAYYAKKMLGHWEKQGYKAEILSVCFQSEWQERLACYRFNRHCLPGKEMYLYHLEEAEERQVLVISQRPCWQVYYEKFVCVTQSFNWREYESLFDEYVKIVREIGTRFEPHRETEVSGLEQVKQYLEAYGRWFVELYEYENSGTYCRRIASREKYLDISVNARNQICEIQVTDKDRFGGTLLAPVADGRGMIERIPRLRSVRLLDPEQVWAAGLRLEYEDGDIRHYYMTCFSENELPKRVTIENVKFAWEQLNSVSISNNHVRFSNGYTIPMHLLYYHSYSQLQMEQFHETVFENHDLRVERLYRLPLKSDWNGAFRSTYLGEPSVCVGPNEILMDEAGNRVSQAAFYTIDREDAEHGYRITVEPTGNVGYIRGDGSWIAPPIYSEGTVLVDGLAQACRNVDGERTGFLITAAGDEIPFTYEVDIMEGNGGLYPFNTMQERHPNPPYAHYYEWDDGLAGNWGFINNRGETVIPAQYVYEMGFYNGGGDHCVVAKTVGDKTLWGVIDRNGNETIPCVYAEVYCRAGNWAAYATESNGDMGLMNMDGTVILEPMFGYIQGYNAEHGLVAAGEHGDVLGVYSLKEQRMLTPEVYDCIEFGERLIFCEECFTTWDQWYDYEGNSLQFENVTDITELGNGLYKVKLADQYGIVNAAGEWIVPVRKEKGNWYPRAFEKGVYISNEGGLYGLRTNEGNKILPEVFHIIEMRGDLFKASGGYDGYHSRGDGIYTADGASVLQGCYRDIFLSYEADRITADSPAGHEVFRVHDK